jgi:protein tyrosine phosphatase (PTP) superfamily phosphohydrolase (DUF442 family)
MEAKVTLSTIPNFIQIDEWTALGGQPSAEQFQAAREAGYQAVVNLAPTATAERSLADEPGLLRDLGFEYHHIPVAWTAPQRDDFERFVAVLDQLGGRQTLIHCAANMRVTAFYALYGMKRLGWSEQRADALMDRVWRTSPIQMPDAWKAFIAETRKQIETAG